MSSDHKTLYEIQNTTLKFFFSFYSIQQKDTKTIHFYKFLPEIPTKIPTFYFVDISGNFPC